MHVSTGATWRYDPSRTKAAPTRRITDTGEC
jgi:hypothetical protein